MIFSLCDFGIFLADGKEYGILAASSLPLAKGTYTLDYYVPAPPSPQAKGGGHIPIRPPHGYAGGNNLTITMYSVNFTPASDYVFTLKDKDPPDIGETEIPFSPSFPFAVFKTVWIDEVV